ncbi:hypothetical protein G6F46_015172 [Rhizopus delemar]|nr:hypothetical protein G6F46_015172 [Rhizopus delemar]
MPAKVVPLAKAAMIWSVIRVPTMIPCPGRQAVVLRLVRQPLQLQPASSLASRRREALPRVGAGQALLHGELPHESGERVIDRGVAHPIRPLTSAVTSATMKSQRCAAARAKPLPACA